jgi:hypothetical protein
MLQRFTAQILEQSSFRGGLTKRRGQGKDILQLGRHCFLQRLQDARYVIFFVARAIHLQYRQVATAFWFALAITNEIRAEQFDRLGMQAARLGRLGSNGVGAVHAEAFEQRGRAGRVQGAERNDAGTAAQLQRRHREPTRQHDDTRNRDRGQVFQQASQLGMHESAKPCALLVLHDFGAVEDEGPALALQDAQELIDTITRGNVRRFVEAFGVCEHFP